MDPATLLSTASCYNCYATQYPLLVLALLDRIAENLGGGPTPPPTDDGILTDPDDQLIATDEGDIIIPD